MFWKRKQEGDEQIQEAQTAGAEKQEAAPKGLFAKLRDRLKATRESIAQKAINLFRLRGKIDDELLEELEEILISADVGVHTTTELISELRDRIRREKKRGSEDSKWLTDTLRSLMREMLEQGDRTLKTAPEGPSIYLVIGVNGVGKTTAIGKLAHRLKNDGRKVLLVAADTFRAAAIDQLDIWSKRADVPIVLGKEGSDPSSVVFNAMEKAKTDSPDAIIIDTAGRLHTKSNLMQELSKMSRVIG
ncbi:MAG: signal recognition particle receptor subunit alpha, partial [Candidatus Hinthialibacter sp.]